MFVRLAGVKAVTKMRALLPSWPSVPGVKLTTPGLTLVRVRFASVRSVELTPVPPGVEAITERPRPSVTGPSVSLEEVCARPLKLSVAPRSRIGAVSFTRSVESVRPVFESVNVPKSTSIADVLNRLAESVSVSVPPVISVWPS